MINEKHCAGCKDDFYNGHNPYGIKVCAMRNKATLVPRLLIPIDLAPPYLKIRPQNVPSCYRRQWFATVKPEAIGGDGYWKR